MEDKPTFPTCPFCGLPGGDAMIPDVGQPGDRLPRVRRGMRWECGTTEDTQSRACATIVERIEAAERRIVEWLRERSRDLSVPNDDSNAWWRAADAIERGEHRG